MPHLTDVQVGCSAHAALGSAIGVKPFTWAIGFALRRLIQAKGGLWWPTSSHATVFSHAHRWPTSPWWLWC